MQSLSDQLQNKSINSQQDGLAACSQLHLFVEHLTNLDFSYVDQQAGLSGQSWVVDLIISGELNAEGMLLDFGDIKKAIKADIESLWDHKLLVPLHLPMLSQTITVDGLHELSWRTVDGLHYWHQGPKISVYELAQTSIDQSFLEQHVADQLLKKWRSKHIQNIKVTLRPEDGDFAFFQYSHGLRLHKGACQRIAHGHRSKLRVFSNNVYHKQYSKVLAAQLEHAYFIDRCNILKETSENFTLGYNAPEGSYKLSVPKSKSIVIQAETTIENIAVHLLHHCQTTLDQKITAVQVYEGWQKGAVAGQMNYQFS